LPQNQVDYMEQNATIQSYEPLEEVQTRPTLFKPKLNLSLEAAHNQVKNAHRIEEHEGTMSFCRTCRIEFERLISDEVYKKMRYNHGKDEHAGHVFMCTHQIFKIVACNCSNESIEE